MSYIGQKGRSLGTQIREHEKSVEKIWVKYTSHTYSQSAIMEHYRNTELW